MKTRLRTIVMYALFGAGIISLFAMPDEESATWLRDMAVTKLLAAAAFAALALCIRRWERIGNH